MGLDSLALIVQKIVLIFKKQATYFTRAAEKILLKSKHVNMNNFSIKNNQYTDFI